MIPKPRNEVKVRDIRDGISERITQQHNDVPHDHLSCWKQFLSKEFFSEERRNQFIYRSKNVRKQRFALHIFKFFWLILLRLVVSSARVASPCGLSYAAGLALTNPLDPFASCKDPVFLIPAPAICHYVSPIHSFVCVFHSI